MSYNVYLVDYTGMPRNHHGIFVETHESGPGTGYLYHVTGNIQTGMMHDHRQEPQPETNSTFGGMKRLLGTVVFEDYGSVRRVVDGVEPPRKQFEGARRLDPGEPLRRCQEWAREAVRALIDSGIVRPIESDN